MAIGTVKWFHFTKGYGFIKSDENNEDAFVHITTLKKPDMISFMRGKKSTLSLSTIMDACQLSI